MRVALSAGGLMVTIYDAAEVEKGSKAGDKVMHRRPQTADRRPARFHGVVWLPPRFIFASKNSWVSSAFLQTSLIHFIEPALPRDAAWRRACNLMSIHQLFDTECCKGVCATRCCRMAVVKRSFHGRLAQAPVQGARTGRRPVPTQNRRCGIV